jgi:hypothetical protein
MLDLPLGSRVLLEPEKRGRKIKITPVPSLKTIAGSFKPRRKALDPVKIREYMERHYKRA